MVKVGRYHVNTAKKKKRFVFHPPPRILPNCKFHSVAKSFKPSPASPNDYQKKKKLRYLRGQETEFRSPNGIFQEKNRKEHR